MKTSIKTIILVAASIFAAMSCQKEAQNPVKAGETIQVSLNANLGDLVANDDTKAAAKSVVRLEWETGDKVQAYCGTEKISTGDGLTVTPSENGLFASLTGEITAPEAGKTITFVYSNGCAADGLTFDFSSQEKSSLPFVAYGTLEYDGSAIAGKMVGFTFATSVMKIGASNLGGGTISSVILSGINTKVTLAPSDSDAPGITAGTIGTISTTNFSAPSDGTRAIITVGLVPDNTASPKRKIAVIQDCAQTADLTSAAIVGNKSYTTLCPFKCVPEILPGEFSVSATKKVHFSRGNLQATYNSSTSSYTWGFAANQYDCIGKAAGNTTIDSQTNGAVVDLFGWSTASTTYGINTSESDSDYSGDFVDWGKAIGDGNTWRTLTSAEWQYLFNTRTMTNEKDRYTLNITYGGKMGLVLYPDNYSGSALTSGKDYTDANFPADCVFLPAAGGRDGSNVYYVGANGDYWSSSAHDESHAYGVYFNSSNVYPDFAYRNYGYSVRLITESK